ncbi:hypothetical protein F8M41_020966 [Gigaspora margarita]|uniref:Uncharacterized protein n=1 Tax=Gigaspora margarita TaxID=4874 RepID=A0A8H4EJ80_GIGMA|nr:hypothetical protein F8M41_020966 [Gigaspora margarita]
MGRTKKSTFTPTQRGAKHTLPSIDLLEEQTEVLSTSSTQSASSSSTQIGSDMCPAKNVVTESNLDMFDDNVLPNPESSDYEDLNYDISENETDHSNLKRKDNENANDDDTNMQKRIRYSSMIKSIQEVQLQMVTVIQDIHRKLDEIYSDWKDVGFGSNIKTDKKWIEDAISQVIYGVIEKTKYPNDELLMKVCYEALVAIKGDEFINKIKYSRWKHFFAKYVRQTRFCRQARSNIVQKIKDTIHTEFEDLIKPKTENHQVTHDEERKFKDASITRECYLKLNKPFDDSDSYYTYLNLIIDRVFSDLKTEKNSIAFGMAVTLNYLDPSKGVNMVPSEVAKRMNYFLEKMQVPEREEV